MKLTKWFENAKYKKNMWNLYKETVYMIIFVQFVFYKPFPFGVNLWKTWSFPVEHMDWKLLCVCVYGVCILN